MKMRRATTGSPRTTVRDQQRVRLKRDGWIVVPARPGLWPMAALCRMARTPRGYANIFNKIDRVRHKTDIDDGTCDGLRQQKTVTSMLSAIRRAARAAFPAAPGAAENPNLLRRMPGCPAQAVHADSDVGMFAVVALTDDYTIGVVSGSHNEPVTERETPPSVHWVTLAAGDALLADCRLLHCGGPASEGRVLTGLHLFFTDGARPDAYLTTH